MVGVGGGDTPQVFPQTPSMCRKHPQWAWSGGAYPLEQAIGKEEVEMTNCLLYNQRCDKWDDDDKNIYNKN